MTDTTFDFHDGNGPVAAHRHRNPDGTLGGWVADTAQVYGTARVYGTALVSGNAQVYGTAQHLLIGPIGSRSAYLTWTRGDNCIATGCFRGSVDEFRASVIATHGDNRHARVYLAALDFIAATKAAWESESS